MTVEAGTICLWYGAIVNIPDGWLHCNGLNDTPNLKDRFVVGAGDTYAPGDFGGAQAHNHNFTSDGHTHEMLIGPNIDAFGGYRETTQINVDTGQTDTNSHLPPYHALAYIMKA